jgi:hypothetical protein
VKRLEYRFDGTASGTTVTSGQGNSGNGTSFDGASTPPTGGVMVYDNTHAHSPANGCKMGTGSTSGSTWMSWSTAFGGAGSAGPYFFRMYFYLTAFPAATIRLADMFNSTGTLTGRINLSTAGVLGITDGTNTDNGTVACALNAWNRIDWSLTLGAGTGRYEWWLFKTNPDEVNQASADEHILGTANKQAGADFNQIRWGMTVAGTNLPGTGVFLWLDDVAGGDTAYIGPAAYRPWTPLAASPTAVMVGASR